MKYVIIDAESIQRKIEELHKICVEGGFPLTAFNADLKQILSQSTPLIPEIEKAFDAARERIKHPDWDYIYEESEDYLSNLKLSSYNQALEDNKEKKYTEEDIKKAIEFGHTSYTPFADVHYSNFIQSLQPKTE